MSTMLQQILFLVIWISQFLVVFGGEIMFNNCSLGTKGAPLNGNNVEVLKLKIDGCDQQPCKFRQSGSYLVEMKLKFNYSATSIMFTHIGLTANYPLMMYSDDKNICQKNSPNIFTTNGSCSDISPGTVRWITGRWLVQPVCPTHNAIWRFIIGDDSSVPQYCGEVTLHVEENMLMPKMPNGRRPAF